MTTNTTTTQHDTTTPEGMRAYLDECAQKNMERQKARCAPFGIDSPSSCGQGYSLQHVNTSFDALLIGHGFAYSHTTVKT
jgi:hypothetical protein